MGQIETGALAEWRRHTMLPIAGALGYATSVIYPFSIGAYIEPISKEFGWSRTLTTSGLTIALLIQVIGSFPIGVLVDKIGPRMLAIAGMPLAILAFALLGTATGDAANWYFLWVLTGFAVLPILPPVWTGAVASRFNASLGLALAVTLCGASVAAAIFPIISAKMIELFGWRDAFAWHAGMWLLIAYPAILLFFRGARDRRGTRAVRESQAERREASGVTLAEGLRSSVYHRLLVANLMFAFAVLGLVVHFIPIVTDSGIGRLEAAGMASLIGFVGIGGRLVTGLLLDRFRASIVGGCAVLLPVIGCLVLIATGVSPMGAMVAAAFIGLSLGAEVDVIAYITTRHFGLKSFGALYGGLISLIAAGTATGPLGAAGIYDFFGNYRPFIWLSVVLLATASLLLFSLPRPPAMYAT